jgi:hypothetical protein
VDRSQLTELHFITPLANLASVMEHGIVSYERAAKLPHQSVAMEEIQERRDKVRIPGGQMLHQYANLYFNARNVMMYVRTSKHLSLGILSIKTSALDLPGVVVADRNASAGSVEFGTQDEILPRLDHDEIFAERWDQHPDYWDRVRHRQAMCAEVLVPGVVPPEFIRGIWLSCEEAKASFDQLDTGVKSRIDPYKFFRGPAHD